MFELIGQTSRSPSVDWTPVIASLAVGGATAILLDSAIASYKLSPGRALVAAAVSIAGAVGASVIAGRIAFRVFRPNLNAGAWTIAVQCAAVAVWLGPLYLITSRRYLWSAAAAAIIAAAIAHVLRGFEHTISGPEDPCRDSETDAAQMFEGLSLPPRTIEMLRAFSAAALTQLGVAAASSHERDVATLFFAAAGFLVGWVIQHRSKTDGFSVSRRAKLSLLFRFGVVLLINAALLTSVSSKWGILQAHSNDAAENNKAGSDGDNLHSGVILLTDVRRHRIIAPAARRRSETSLAPARQVTIPFTGEYWVYIGGGALAHPPASSLVRTGTPLGYNFTHVDRSPLSMVARQSFEDAVQVSCCNRIDIAISSTDQQATAVSVELVLVNTQVHVKGWPQAQSLGEVRLSSAVPIGGGRTAAETLHFDVPSDAALRQFNEIRIVFHLEAPRGHRSANVAVTGFNFARRS